MKLIVIRGNSGSGKTIITDTLADKLGAEKIHIDYLKTATQKDLLASSNPVNWKGVYKDVARETMARLAKMKSDGVPLVIIEELLTNKEFTKDLEKYCVDNSVEVQWFRIERGIEKIIELGESPERATREIRNSKENIEMIESQIRENVIEGEVVIMNNGIIEDAIHELLVNISGEGARKEISFDKLS
ncbi:MAG: hypothetical protein Q8N43_01495 [Candidatus Azambacteria bacterium]|nr:hypothetical protein [Candidatus Azambacteria bacterium]